MNKQVVTIGIIILIVFGIAFFLFKISPEEKNQLANSAYQLDTSGAKQISAPLPFDPATDRYQGDAKAKNVFIEYSDYQCPACAVYSEILKQVPAVFGDTVFVYRYFPLTQIHKNSVISSLAAEAAGAQGKYWEMHDILFSKQTEWEGMAHPLETFAQYAQQIGVANIDQFKTDITSQKYKAVIEKNNNEALGLSLPGTPAMFFNGHNLQNADLAGLKQQAEQFRNK